MELIECECHHRSFRFICSNMHKHVSSLIRWTILDNWVTVSFLFDDLTQTNQKSTKTADQSLRKQFELIHVRLSLLSYTITKDLKEKELLSLTRTTHCKSISLVIIYPSAFLCSLPDIIKSSNSLSDSCSRFNDNMISIPVI